MNIHGSIFGVTEVRRGINETTLCFGTVSIHGLPREVVDDAVKAWDAVQARKVSKLKEAAE